MIHALHIFCGDISGKISIISWNGSGAALSARLDIGVLAIFVYKTMHKSIVCGALILIAGLTILLDSTDVLQAFTAQAALKVMMKEQKPLWPEVELYDQTGATFQIAPEPGLYHVISFMYARCPTICLAGAGQLAKLNNWTANEKALAVRFVSVSFDPQDGPEELMHYARMHDSRAPRWRVARIPLQVDREILLRRMGVLVLPDPAGGFVHNAGFYLIDPSGRCIALYDLNETEAVLAHLKRLSGGNTL